MAERVMEEDKYQVWQCRVCLDKGFELPDDFDNQIRRHLWNVLKDAGIPVTVIFSERVNPTQQELAIIRATLNS